jgi:hypothetical protein
MERAGIEPGDSGSSPRTFLDEALGVLWRERQPS